MYKIGSSLGRPVASLGVSIGYGMLQYWSEVVLRETCSVLLLLCYNKKKRDVKKGKKVPYS